jgi:hypothetical protein
MKSLMKMGAFLLVVGVSATGCLVDSAPEEEPVDVDAVTESADVDVFDYEQAPVEEDDVSRFDAYDVRDRYWYTMHRTQDGQVYWEQRPFDIDREGGEPSLTRGDLDSE